MERRLGDGWVVWNEGDTRVVLAYRPDVFDGDDFPAPCLPTVYVTRGRRSRRPGPDRTTPPDAPWIVTLYLEPAVAFDEGTNDSREAALEAAAELTARFAAGELDYRARYQVPREAYLAKLDELTGRDPS